MAVLATVTAAICSENALAQANSAGQSGLINMPDARVGVDGTLRFGFAYTNPYANVWSSVAFFPWLEVSGRYVTIDGVPGFQDPSLGDYRDKVFDGKLLLLREAPYLPALAVGIQDFVGTKLFTGKYLALSKRWGTIDATVGWGEGRIDGMFGGVRYTPDQGRWGLLLEYDANDYANDFRANVSGADRRVGGAVYGLEYHADWWRVQIARQHADWAANLYLSIPLSEPEFVPKLYEPPPYVAAHERPTQTEWREQPAYATALVRTLTEHGYDDVAWRLDDDRLSLALTHRRISHVGRAVGRAVRIALAWAPRDIERLKMVYTVQDQPIVTYEFSDIQMLDQFFRERADWSTLEPTIDIRFASLGLAHHLRHAVTIPNNTDTAVPAVAKRFYRSMSSHRLRDNAVWFPFNLRVYFNDPGAPVRYDTFSMLGYRQSLAHGVDLIGAARLTLLEDVSDIRHESNSVLPHVRSDIGQYRRHGDPLRLDNLLLRRFSMLRERLYTRLSVGYYEEMYAGAGAQFFYLPSSEHYSVDVAVDWLRQRSPGEAFGFRDYRTITALASFHYRLPRYGLTTTLRAGRFLARDEGVRLEAKRRFGSGTELGFWYTRTNGKDVTSPGSPERPYHDKGLFISIPLGAMLPSDTQERSNFSLANFTRDVGQMVRSPGDWYPLLEQTFMWSDAHRDVLTGFAQ
jgi:hypothetical protein